MVRSELSDRYAVAFEGMQMESRKGDTILTGEVKDQPHLFGILDRINALGLELLSVRAFPEEAHPISESNGEPKSTLNFALMEFSEVAASRPTPHRMLCSPQRINGRWSMHREPRPLRPDLHRRP